ncbi:MAG: hypothetical protein CMN75_17205 [Spirochaeta sp.]|nr:hypothetical protein [Spirochaeta sp.]
MHGSTRVRETGPGRRVIRAVGQDPFLFHTGEANLIRIRFFKEGPIMPSRHLRSMVAMVSLVVLFSIPGCAGNPGDKKGTTAERKNVVIQINQFKVHPAVVRVPAEGNSIVWTNYSDLLAAVSFPAAVADDFTCSDVRPNFVVNGPLMESITIVGGREGLWTPCPLKPGTYEYEVHLFNSTGNRYNAQLNFKGKIEVGP